MIYVILLTSSGHYHELAYMNSQCPKQFWQYKIKCCQIILASLLRTYTHVHDLSCQYASQDYKSTQFSSNVIQTHTDRYKTVPYLLSQVRTLCLKPSLQGADVIGEGAVVCLQGLAAAVERTSVPGLLVAVHHLIHVAVQAQTLVHQGQHLLSDGGHFHAHLCSRVLECTTGKAWEEITSLYTQKY